MAKSTSQNTAKWRGYGEESAIGRWIRNNPDIPSRGTETAHAVTNTDFQIHAYMQSVDGYGCGTREVQSLMRIEFKTHGAMPCGWQVDTLFKEHCGVKHGRGYKVKGHVIINHGVFFCVCSGTSPSDSDWIKWGRFRSDGSIDWQNVTPCELTGILRFDLHPKTLRRQWLRRHHKKSVIHKVVEMPLGFEVDEMITKRS